MDKKAIKKISFVKGLNKWSWMIGTGFYEDDLITTIENKKEQLNKEFKKALYKTLEISFNFSNYSTYKFNNIFQRYYKKKFRDYKLEIKQHLLENTRQQNILAQQSKMAAMGEMIGNIAHQWRQPLSAITTTATGLKLQKEMNILEDSFLIKSLEGINKSAQYLSKTIDDFRNFFKTDKKETVFSIQKALDKAISLVYVQFHNKDIEIIKNNYDEQIINLENEFIQVIINILNNARDELIKKNLEYKKIYIH